MHRPPTLTSALFALLLSLFAPPASADSAALRARVMANIQASRQARQASAFHQHVQRVKAPRPTSSITSTPIKLTMGPAKVPHGAIVFGEFRQPSVQFDKAQPALKRQILAKAAKLRLRPELGAWQKVERIQKVINQKVTHGGNELSVEKNPNRYTKFNAKRQGKLVKLGDYLKVKVVACREKAFFTQAALEAAGFETRLVSGTVKDQRGRPIGGHAWNEIKLDGKWYMVDTTNPQFNRTDPARARTEGTSGWVWHPHADRFMVGSRGDWNAFKANDRPY